MATGSRTAGCHSGVIEGCGVGERRGAMARAAIRIRRYVLKRAEIRFADGDGVVVALHTLMPGHFGTRVIEGAPGKRRCRGWIPCVTGDAITRCRHVVYCFPGCSQPVMTGRTWQSVVYAPGIQCRVVEARYKSAAGLMALLTQIRRRRVRWTLTDGSSGIACDMATYTRLGLDGRILVVDRIGFQEIACRGVTRIAFPAIGIDCGMHRIAWMTPG